MRTIERSSAFKKDFRRESSGQYRKALDQSLSEVLLTLVRDLPLQPRHRDHELSGNWLGWRECHIKPDLLLIYCKVGDRNKGEDPLLRLARLGSHSELFG